jgi:hypothetical protein
LIAFLKLSAQSCNNGIGKLVYEKVSDYKLNGIARFGTNKAIKEVVRINSFSSILNITSLYVIFILILDNKKRASDQSNGRMYTSVPRR